VALDEWQNAWTMIVIESLHHVSVTVTDLARARHFYGDVLGLRELPRPPFDFGGAWYETGDQQLHLIVHPPARTLRGTAQIDSRDGHLALRVASYHETLEYLRAQGVTLLDRHDNLTPWAQIYVTDPDGNVIELNAVRGGK
jgi:catechol 2,3-dioxygenase-like lactoylglutathione lyase family enzyme